MNTKLEIAFFIFIFFVLLCNIFWIIKTEGRLKKFFLGKKARDLEDTLVHLENEVKNLKERRDKIEAELLVINQKLKQSIRGIHTMRFNPFPDQGSNQSFAIGMQNENGDGVVISSLYSRDRMSVFAKPIKKGISEYELTEEEREVVNKTKV